MQSRMKFDGPQSGIRYFVKIWERDKRHCRGCHTLYEDKPFKQVAREKMFNFQVISDISKFEKSQQKN